MAQLKYEQLESKHDFFRAPSARLSIDGNDLSQKGFVIESAEVNLTTKHEAGACTIKLSGVYDRKASRFTCEDTLQIGAVAELELGYIKAERVFKGFIHTIEYCVGSEDTYAEIVCLDAKGAMMGTGTLDFTGDMSVKQIIQGFFSGEHARGYVALCKGPDMGGAAGLDQKPNFLPTRMDDYLFVTSVADYYGLEFFVLDDSMVLRKKPKSGNVLIELVPSVGITSISAKLSAEGYQKSVTVYGVNDTERTGNKRTVSYTAQNSKDITGGKGKEIIGKRHLEIFSHEVTDHKTAQSIAEAQMIKANERVKTVTIETQGLPEFKIGSFISLSKFTPKIDGKLYIAEINHSYSKSGYSTKLICEGL